MLQSLFSAIHVSATGLSAQRYRMNLISENIANAETTRTPEGGAYNRKLAVLESGTPGEKFSDIYEKNRISMEATKNRHIPDEPFREPMVDHLKGVQVSETIQSDAPHPMVYDPHHPDANADGYVEMPNVNIVQEMTDLITASRSYEANVTALNSSKDMIRKALRI